MGGGGSREKRIPRLATNTDWCPYVAVVLGEAVAFGVAAEAGLHAGVLMTAEWGMVIGAAAIASHETGTRLPTVLSDLMGYLNFKNFGSADVDAGKVDAGMAAPAPEPVPAPAPEPPAAA